jgi:hypothetical protein
MSPLELAALHPIRRHREAQAERAWHDARRRLEGLLQRVADAEGQLEQARRQQREQRQRLASEHQGQALTPLTLAAWGEQERRLLGQLASDEAALLELREQRLRQQQQADRARLRLRERQRQLEKLKELTALLTEDGDHGAC